MHNFRKQQNEKAYWLYGKHSVLSALNNPNRKITQLLVTNNSIKFFNLKNIDIKDLGVNYKIIQKEEISRIIEMPGVLHQGVALKVLPIIQRSFYEMLQILKQKQKSIVVILDQILDPHNIGAIIRTAAAFGVDVVINTKNNSPEENSTLVKSSSGAFEIIPYIQVVNLISTIKELKSIGYWVIGLTHTANSNINNISLDFEKIAIILGSEEKGLRKLSSKHCDLLTRINISNSVESLNVSNAAAIALHKIALNL